MSQNHTIEVRLAVLDEETLKENARKVSGDDPSSMEETIASSVVNPSRAPLDSGYEILRKDVLIQDGECTLTIECLVQDPDRLKQEARDCYAENWGREDWEPESCEESLYEILVASNANPSPVDIGFEIIDWKPVGAMPRRSPRA